MAITLTNAMGAVARPATSRASAKVRDDTLRRIREEHELHAAMWPYKSRLEEGEMLKLFADLKPVFSY